MPGCDLYVWSSALRPAPKHPPRPPRNPFVAVKR